MVDARNCPPADETDACRRIGNGKAAATKVAFSMIDVAVGNEECHLRARGSEYEAPAGEVSVGRRCRGM